MNLAAEPITMCILLRNGFRDNNFKQVHTFSANKQKRINLNNTFYQKNNVVLKTLEKDNWHVVVKLFQHLLKH